jgi:hypothetical protein
MFRSLAILDNAFSFVIDKSDVLRRAVRGRKIGWGQMAKMSFLSLGLEFKWEESRALRLIISGHCTPYELHLMTTDSRRLVFQETTYIVSWTSSLGVQVILVRIFILSYALVECWNRGLTRYAFLNNALTRSDQMGPVMAQRQSGRTLDNDHDLGQRAIWTLEDEELKRVMQRD